MTDLSHAMQTALLAFADSRGRPCAINQSTLAALESRGLLVTRCARHFGAKPVPSHLTMKGRRAVAGLLA